MSDEPERPFYAPGYVGKPAAPRPGEPLWTIHRGDRRIRCELRFHHEFGVEAQILGDGELMIGRRFDTKRQAVQWADLERAALERDGWALGPEDTP